MRIWPLGADESIAKEIAPTRECSCVWCLAAAVSGALPEPNMIIFLTNGKDVFEVVNIDNNDGTFSLACRKSSKENFDSFTRLNVN